jgi:hypothetical protein
MKIENPDSDFVNINIMAETQTGGNAALQNLAVPAGLFFIQQAFTSKTPLYKDSENGEMMPVSLYDRLLELKIKKKKPTKKINKQIREKKRKSKKVKK